MPKMRCACTHQNEMRLLNSFGLHMRISFWTAHAHLILVCAGASYFGLPMRMLFWIAHAHIVLRCVRPSYMV